VMRDDDGREDLQICTHFRCQNAKV
jgi:hypothetical protein